MTNESTAQPQEAPINKSKAGGKKTQEKQPEVSGLGYLREWSDALVIAFVVAMFIRMFVVELFKIPTGSMSPSLLGGLVAEGQANDRTGDLHEFLLVADPSGLVQVFRKLPDGYYNYEGKQVQMALTASQQALLSQRLVREEHRIAVNKFSYWFSEPERGDIVIFRVPFKLDPQPFHLDGESYPGYKYERNQSVYVKRAVALGGDHLRIGDDRHLYINGEKLTKPEILGRLQYLSPEMIPDFEIDVPEGHIMAMGDNSGSSLDSRYWGPLPEGYLRGKAILRYMPLKKIKILNPD